MALFLVGFLMATLGVALLVLGETPLFGGRVIAARRARWVGGVLVGFFPCLFLVHGIVDYFDTANQIPSVAVGWSLFSVWLCVAFGMLFRSLFPKQLPRPRPSRMSNPFDSEPTLEEDLILEEVDDVVLEEVVLEEVPKPKPVRPPKPSPPKAPPAKKPAKRTPMEEENPFDFS